MRVKASGFARCGGFGGDLQPEFELSAPQVPGYKASVIRQISLILLPEVSQAVVWVLKNCITVQHPSGVRAHQAAGVNLCSLLQVRNAIRDYC